ncbi:hypothetical protein PGH45_14295 [Legionella pneumophila]|nr:hypothetical protein [Legionella pneumophila]
MQTVIVTDDLDSWSFLSELAPIVHALEYLSGMSIIKINHFGSLTYAGLIITNRLAIMYLYLRKPVITKHYPLYTVSRMF